MTPATNGDSWSASLPVAALLALATLLLHGAALWGGWRWDDGGLAALAVDYTPRQYFLDPQVMRLHSGANVAPWNLLFYDINLSLFGMRVSWHYAHMLLLLALGAVLLYAVLRQWLPSLAALAGALAFLLGKPLVHVSAGLMHGHYATGLVLALLAAWAWVHYLRGALRIWWWVSALAYLFATSCKEVYVPLVLVLPLLPVATPRQRALALLPHVAVAGLYVLWRYMVLGRLLGGYGNGTFDVGHALLQVLDVPRLLVAQGWLGGLTLAAGAALLLWTILARRLRWGLAVVLVAVAGLPLLALVAFPGIREANRYLFAPWVMVCIGLAAAWPRRPVPAAAGLVALVLLLGLSQHQERRRLRADLDWWDTLSAFALSADARRQALYVGADDGFRRLMFAQLRHVSGRVRDEPPADQAAELEIVDQAGNRLQAVRAARLDLMEYAGKQGMRPMSDARLRQLFPDMDSAPAAIPLQATLELRAGVLHWEFGPHAGPYQFNLQNHPAIRGRHNFVPLPHQGAVPWLGAGRRAEVSLCHDARQPGSMACSPTLVFELREGVPASWQGAGTPAVVTAPRAGEVAPDAGR